MRLVQFVVCLAAISLISACSLFNGSNSSNGVTADIDSYTGTASVGDFIEITVDHDARTIDYTNRSNSTSGHCTYTVNDSDGRFIITDSFGSFTDGYEIPGYALVLRATKTGASANQTSLVTAIQKERTTIASVANKDYNMMQFRVNSGGMELGHVHIDNDGTIHHSSYWPYGDTIDGSQAFMPDDPTSQFEGMTEDVTTGSLVLDIVDNGQIERNYIFGTTGGFLAVDTPNGNLVCLEQNGSGDFETTNAGTYSALFFSKSGAQTGVGNVESPTSGDVDRATLTVGSGGSILVQDSIGTTIATGTLVAIKDDATLSTGIGDECHGLFFVDIATTGADASPVTQRVFMTFLKDGTHTSMLFASFKPDSSITSGTYSYFYGCALKQVAGDG